MGGGRAVGENEKTGSVPVISPDVRPLCSSYAASRSHTALVFPVRGEMVLAEGSESQVRVHSDGPFIFA